MAQAGDLCLSFRHKVSGLHSGTLQVFVRKNGAHGPAVWGRNGGHGWRQTHITLQGRGIKSVSTHACAAFWDFLHEMLKTLRWCCTGLFVFWVQFQPVFYYFDPCEWNHIKDKTAIVHFFRLVLCKKKKKNPTYSNSHKGNDKTACIELPRTAQVKRITMQERAV